MLSKVNRMTRRLPMRTWVLYFATALSLSACGNVHESLTLGEWKEVGTREAPLAKPADDLDITQITPGNGAVVKPGDLVKVRITAKGQGVDEDVSVIESPGPWEAWLWTGSEPEDQDESRWGSLGSANFRTALIGRSIQEHLNVQLNERAEKFIRIPLHGGISWLNSYFRADPTQRRLRKSPFLAISRAGSIDVEIVKTCTGHLLHREGTMTQWGLTWARVEGLQTVLRNRLLWSTLQGDCPSSEAPERIEFGPNSGVWPARDDAHRVLHDDDWQYSYPRLRPASQFPSEYEPDAVWARELPRRRIVGTAGGGRPMTECDYRQDSFMDPYPTLLPELSNAVAIFPVRHAAILTKSGEIRYWFPLKDCRGMVVDIPMDIIPEPGIKNVVFLTATMTGAMALRSDGTGWSLGHLPTQFNWHPLQLYAKPGALRPHGDYAEPLRDIGQIAAGDHHVLALTKDGVVFAGGQNDCGQVAQLGRVRGNLLPISGLPRIKAIAGGLRTSWALDVHGDVWTWGHQGPIYNNSATRDALHCPKHKAVDSPYGEPPPQPIPKRISGLTDITAISAYLGQHLLALKRDGTVWGWGLNDCGQLGIDEDRRTGHPYRNTPVKVEGIDHIVAVAAGPRFSVALRADGRVWSWGRLWYENHRTSDPKEMAKRVYARPELPPTERPRSCVRYGSIETPGVPSPVPMLVPEITNATAISAGGYHALALTADGRVWSWGGPS